MSYERIRIQGWPVLKGNPGHEIVEKPFLDILPGCRINKIGRLTNNGKESSSCRVLEITPFMTFVGWFFCEEGSFLAFRLPDNGITGWDLFNPQLPVYSLFVPNIQEGQEPELILQNVDTRSIRIFKAVFSLF